VVVPNLKPHVSADESRNKEQIGVGVLRVLELKVGTSEINQRGY
jgi:hypothetical protein